MGACASLCRVDTAPRHHGRAKEREPQAQAQPATSAAAAETETAEPPSAPPAAVRLGFAPGFAARYELGHALGHGQFATVRAARDRATGAAVAVKVIPKTLLNEAPENAEHIRREVHILKALRGRPHVVRLHEAYEDDAEAQLVLELCSGGELFDRVVREGHLSERRAAGVMRAVLTLVAECHLAGVVHRDVKPENFMFSSRRSDAPLVAVDFGSATYCAPGQLLSELVGSVYYVAPEVLRRRYGPPADVWSCGVLLYVLLSGTLPFLGATEAGTYAAVLAGRPDLARPPWHAVSGPARDLVRQLLCRDPAARPSAAAALSHPWLRNAEGAEGDADVPLDAAALAALARFARLGALRRAALRALAAATPPAELPRDVADQYAAVDADGDGRVSRRELRAALARLADVARAAKAHADADADAAHAGSRGGSTDADDDDEGGSVAGSLMSETEAGEAAAALDADGDGVITLRDFAAAALRPARGWAAAEGAATPAAAVAARARWLARARAAFDALDADADGVIGTTDLRAAGRAEGEPRLDEDLNELSFAQFCRLLRGEPLQPPQPPRGAPPPAADAVAAEAAARGAADAVCGGAAAGDERAEDAQARGVEAAATSAGSQAAAAS